MENRGREKYTDEGIDRDIGRDHRNSVLKAQYRRRWFSAVRTAPVHQPKQHQQQHPKWWRRPQHGNPWHPCTNRMILRLIKDHRRQHQDSTPHCHRKGSVNKYHQAVFLPVSKNTTAKSAANIMQLPMFELPNPARGNDDQPNIMVVMLAML